MRGWYVDILVVQAKRIFLRSIGITWLPSVLLFYIFSHSTRRSIDWQYSRIKEELSWNSIQPLEKLVYNDLTPR